MEFASMKLRSRLAVVCVLAATAVSSTFAQTAAELDSSIREHVCPANKIDTRGLPDFGPCKALEPDYMRVDRCQTQAQHYASLAYEYNRMYEACHPDAASADLANRLAGQRAKISAAAAADTRQALERQYDDAVSAAQKSYQAREAQEQVEQEARQQATRQSRRYEQRAQSSECVPKDMGYGNYCYKRCGVDAACGQACAQIPPCE
jgi:hypothetical protein